MKKLALSAGTLCCYGLAPTPLTTSNPRFVNTFHLVRLVLMGHFWSWLCLRGHHIHVLRRLWSQRHNLRGLYLPSLSFSQLPRIW